jgi:crotonobetainyl-CoA:carnitine CoA-transferase CaiB-like acyl-CoA transferase
VTAFFGRGAVTDSMTEPGGDAINPRPAQGDHTTGLAMVAAILAALRLAEQTGQGQVVDVSLMGTAAWTMATDLSAPLIDGRMPTKRDRRHLISPLANRFRCSDDRWIVLNMPELHWWPRFCETVNRPDLLADPRFETTKSRFDNMPALIDEIDATFATRTLAEWGKLFDQAGLIWGPASTLVELCEDEQAAAAGVFADVEHPSGTFRTVAVPMKIHGADIKPRGPAPEIGEHTSEVLQGLGLTADEVRALAAAGVVGALDLEEG